MSGRLGPGDRVAVLGLGNMGTPMAGALARAGFRVVGWTRSGRRPERLSSAVAIAASAPEAARGAVALLLATADDVAAEAALFGTGAADALAPGALVIDTGTSGTARARDHARRLRDRGLGYLDAPVSGGVAGAEAATLSLLVGGEAADVERGRTVLEALGSPTHLGPAGAGQAAKLANQVIVAVTIAAVAEGIALAEAQGLDAEAFLAAVRGGFADSAILRAHGPRMAARDFGRGGPMRLHRKDLRLAAEAAPGAFACLGHARRVAEGFDRLIGQGKAEWDHSAYLLACLPEEPSA